MENNILFVTTIIQRLQHSNIDPIVFGGWAEELTGNIPSRPHKDLDLLYLAPDFALVDLLLNNSPEIKEILPKHFHHKRAFVWEGVMVELLLIEKRGGRHFTDFWNSYLLEWPQIKPEVVFTPYGKLKVANHSITSFYRDNYDKIDKARIEYIRNIKK